MGCCCTQNEYLNRKGFQINIDTLLSHHHYVNNITINSQKLPPKTSSQTQGSSSEIGNQPTQSQTNRPDSSNCNKSSFRESVEEDFSFLNDFQNDYKDINTNQIQEPPPNNNYLGKNFMRFHGKLDTIRETNSDISFVKGMTFEDKSAFSQSNNGCKINKENTINHGNELIKQIRKIFSNNNKKNSNEFNNTNNPMNNDEEFNGQCIINNSGRKSESEMVVNYTRKIKTYQKRNITCEIIESNEGKGNEMVTNKYTITYEDCIQQPYKYKNKSKFGCRSNSSKILLLDTYT